MTVGGRKFGSFAAGLSLVTNLLVPSTHRPGSPVNLIIYMPGVGDSNSTFLDVGEAKTPVWDLCMSRGYMLIGGQSNWGVQSAVNFTKGVYDFVDGEFGVDKVMLFGQSMGGLGSLNTISQGVLPPAKLKGFLGIYPACNLAAMYGGVYQSSIKTAYGIASDGSDYASKTAGYDPVLRTPSTFAGLRYRMYHSPGDTVVGKAANTDTFKTILDGISTVEATVITTSGDHGDASNFQTTDQINFIDRCFS